LCRWKEGSVHVPNCKNFPVTETERKHVRRSERFKQHRDACCQQVHPPARPKEIHAILIEILGEALWISAKSIAEQLVISRERVGSIILEDLDMRKLSAKWVPKCLNTDQKRQRCEFSEQILEFFSARSKRFPVAFGDHGLNLVTSL
jgi:hypothetical protein